MSTSHPILSTPSGETELLLGNEAIVRGALEAGVQVVTCYPGTPSSEVPDTFYRLQAQGADSYRFEYSVNEKVALEVAGGATLAGAKTLVTMKHVGVNVAADPLMTLAYIGAPGGLVLLSADDPGCHSSQNEQDNRIFARLAGYPVFEPATAQEAKEMTRDALNLSREWGQPVMLRTTTRLNHIRGPVEMGEVPTPEHGPTFVKNPMRYVPIPAVARLRHGELLHALERIREHGETSPYNRVSGSEGAKVGVVASGISRAYVADVIAEHDLEDRVKLLELGLSYPLPEGLVRSFLAGLDTVVVVEEGEGVIEAELRSLAQRESIAVTILGKDLPALPRTGEYSTANVRAALLETLGEDASPTPTCPEAGQLGKLPLRPPNLCAGCPHRATYYTVREVFGDDAVYSSDIGCYTLGILPPLSCADFLLCMGSSVSAGSGFASAQDKPVVAFIGDSTFFHSGITGLINAVFNHHDLIVVILDNHTTAMTGHQPHPGVPDTIAGANPCRVDIEAIVRGCGVCQVLTVNPTNHKATKAAIEELREQSGVRVLIAREPCPLHERRIKGTKPTRTATVAAQSASVQKTLTGLACPAFSVEAGVIAVNEAMCSGCMFCLQLSSDIKAAKRGSR